MFDLALVWWFVFLAISIGIGAMAFSSYLTQPPEDVEKLRQHIEGLNNDIATLSAEKQQLEIRVRELEKSNKGLQSQLNSTVVSTGYVKAQPPTNKQDEWNDVVGYGLAIHRQYIIDLTANFASEKRLYSRDEMVRLKILTPAQWNRGMEALRESGAILKGIGNNSKSTWASDDSKRIRQMLEGWADGKR